jgi:hypothetical protein
MSGGPRPFRPITSAPSDTNVEVTHGPRGSVALARWDSKLKTWVRVGYTGGAPLVRVTGWRPVPTED